MEDLIVPHAEVKHVKELKCMRVVFDGFISYDDIMKVFEHEYEMIRHYKLKRCIVDLRKMQVYAVGVKEYVKDEWFPRVTKEGLKQIAFVVPENLFGELSMKVAHKDAPVESEVNIQYFKDQEAAQQWFEQTLSPAAFN